MLHAPSCVELFLQCNRQFSLLVLRYGRGFLTFYYKIHSLSRYLFSAGSFLNTPVKFSLINSSFNQTVLSLSGSENLLSHIHSREKGGFQIIQKLLRTSGSQPDCSASADPRPRWKAGRGNRPLLGVAKKVFHHRASWPQSVNAELDYLPARPAFPAADTEKALFRHDSPFFSLYIDNTSTEIRLSRYCTTAICGPAYSRDSSCGSGWAAGRLASQKWR